MRGSNSEPKSYSIRRGRSIHQLKCFASATLNRIASVKWAHLWWLSGGMGLLLPAGVVPDDEWPPLAPSDDKLFFPPPPPPPPPPGADDEDVDPVTFDDDPPLSPPALVTVTGKKSRSSHWPNFSFNSLLSTVLRQIFVHCATFSSTFAAFPRPSCYIDNITK